mmetsp:Transcript_12417/g.14256  ORF Transcript_12417/g.14256 Transcript_12417/m.14256 type:complete len:430 (+) Transcript_12417:156-1445(+)|eukprot:CAMPEP_0184031772 /NCGR_PEP_ID=MMETSP0955-20130417/2493_1 /TAXON_ID=627963 /ORGANISM="Aplanochytrium sp, Strain PBS07" /LENGTH=429 /DNA_ID=CAMNT_0026317619 /DNA_START=62 /DNA_END=1351 /DNA_ORIENTATION=+
MDVNKLLKYLRRNPKYVAVGVAAVLAPIVLRSGGTRGRAIAEDLQKIAPTLMSFSEFLQNVEKDKVKSVLLHPDSLEFTLKTGGETYLTHPTTYHPGIVDLLHNKTVPFDQVKVTVKPAPAYKTFLIMLFPFAYLAICIYVFRRYIDQTGSAGKLNRASKKPKTTFADVAGIDNAREVVSEVTDFLQNPKKYTSVGARVPSGILLVGPPGTGKTMLARAMANEAGLPFFYCSGSDFVEVYAGRGAGRIRKLFQRAAKAAPSVVFFDEIDALGKARGNELSMNEEREQTLNQLLAAMDGFDTENGVVVMAATNRYEILDKALTRPGRFDRIVRVDLPQQGGRYEILKVHTRNMSLNESVDLETIASLTDGFSGAELAHLANEAAIIAVRNERTDLYMDDFFDALDEFRLSRKRNPSPSAKGFMDLLKTLN